MPGRDRRPPPTLRHGAVNFGLPLSRRNLEGSLRSRRSLGSRRPLPFPGSAYGAQPYRGAAPGPPPPPPPAGSGYYPPPAPGPPSRVSVWRPREAPERGEAPPGAPDGEGSGRERHQPEDEAPDDEPSRSRREWDRWRRGR